MGRYVTTFNTVDEWANYSPAGLGHFSSSDTRGWTDANSNYVAECNFLNPAPNGECGPGNPFFAKTVLSPLTVDPALVDGWNTREYSWDMTAGITQEIAPTSVAPGRLRPTELGKPAGHDQPCVDAGRLRHVRLQRAAAIPGCQAAAATR